MVSVKFKEEGVLYMKKSERLELENKILKNMLENIQCEIRLYHGVKPEGHPDPYMLIGSVHQISIDFESRLEFAEKHGYVEYGPTIKEMG